MRRTHYQKTREYRTTIIKYVTNTLRTGGITVSGTGGKIEINNTLDERLKLLETAALPSIRLTLFGENKNRRFHD